MRALAKRFNLPVAEKKDSQGVCFLGAVSVKEFLEKELGNDNPALLYTIGQRISSDGLPSEAKEEKGPWYVIGKDVGKKEIRVSKTRASTARAIHFRNANWFGDPALAQEAQYRYRGPRISGRVEGNHVVSAALLSEKPAPGQSIVFYQDTDLIGGGTIA